MPFEIVRNDITNMRVDAIVNTANPKPQIGYGVDAGIHQIAGPVGLDGRHKEEKLLRSCYEIVKRQGCQSIAFPLISARNHGFPTPLALQTHKVKKQSISS